MISGSALGNTNRPPNFPLRASPIPRNTSLSTVMRYTDNSKSFRLDNRLTTSQICMAVREGILMAREVTDGDKFPSERIRHNGYNHTRASQVIFLTFVNDGMYLKNSSGGSSSNPHKKQSSLTWCAGLSSGVGNTPIHFAMRIRVKGTRRKRCRRHGTTHDFDTREQDKKKGRKKGAAGELVLRWSRISSMISCGILGVTGTTDSLDFAGAGCFSIALSGSITRVVRNELMGALINYIISFVHVCLIGIGALRLPPCRCFSAPRVDSAPYGGVADRVDDATISHAAMVVHTIFCALFGVLHTGLKSSMHHCRIVANEIWVVLLHVMELTRAFFEVSLGKPVATRCQAAA